jgi:protein subunit release factor A
LPKKANFKTEGEKMILDKLIELRRQRAELDRQLKELEEAAIAEAMDRVSKEGKQTFQHEGVKIQLSFRTVKPKPKDDPQLGELHELIEEEREAARLRNKQQIEDKEKLISQLQQDLEALTSNEEIQKLEGEYEQLEKDLTTKVPSLSVYLGES